MLSTKTPEHNSSILPHVLEEYVPEYRPKHQASLSPRRSKDTSQDHVSEGTEDERKVKTSQKRTEEKQKHRSLSPTYSTSHRKRGQSETERYEQLSQRWDQAKSEVRADQFEQLKEKVLLQRQLIQRQDVYAQKRREHMEQQAIQQRETQKNNKQKREAALQEKCKLSLEEDRKAIQQDKRNKIKEAKQAQHGGSTPSSPSSPEKAVPRHGSFQPHLPPLSRTPSNLEMSEADRRRLRTPSGGSRSDMEWYKSQLYQMFGNEADSFLHPKIEQQVKKPVNSKLAKQGGSTQKMDQILESLSFDPLGRAGAEKLWDTLRKESIIRLLREDAHIEQELKDTYSAFVRESLGTNKKIVRRNFYAQDDVPELGRLLDQSMLNAVRTNKHKVDLMYRASVNNMDRTKILTHNSPLPLTEGDSGEPQGSCVARYLPSWMDDVSEASNPEYAKWLQNKSMIDTTTDQLEDPSEDKENKDPWKKEEVDDELILLMTRSRRPKNQPKYIFLTEKDARVKGTFADKFKDEREYKDIPRPYVGGAKSVMAMPSPEDTTVDLQQRTGSAPLPQKHVNNYEKFLTPWEPLSMKALVEYKTQVQGEGDGEFGHGRVKTWKTEINAN